MDQFASKVVEKCLKIGGPDFLSRYLDRVCEGRHDRPRIPLIDIASDQYGNYLTGTVDADVIDGAGGDDEIVIAIGGATSGRAHARTGDRYQDMKEMGIEPK